MADVFTSKTAEGKEKTLALEEKAKKKQAKQEKKYQENLDLSFAMTLPDGMTKIGISWGNEYVIYIANYCCKRGIPMIHNNASSTSMSFVHIHREKLDDGFVACSFPEELTELEGITLEIKKCSGVSIDGKPIRKYYLEVRAKTSNELKDFFKRVLAVNSLDARETLRIMMLNEKGEATLVNKLSYSVLKLSVLTSDQKELLTRLERVFNKKNEKQFAKNGMIPKHNLLFYGLPGSGKTNFAQVIAMRLQREMWRINVLSKDVISRILNTSERLVIVLEDADALLQSRNTHESNGEQNGWLGSILSLLDGTKCPHLFILTTNYPKTLDIALSRSGRIATRMAFGWAPKEQILEVCKMYHPEEVAKVIEKELAKIPHLTLSMIANFCQIEYYKRFDDPKHLPSVDDYTSFRKEAQQFEEKWNANPIVDKPTTSYM